MLSHHVRAARPLKAAYVRALRTGSQSCAQRQTFRLVLSLALFPVGVRLRLALLRGVANGDDAALGS